MVLNLHNSVYTHCTHTTENKTTTCKFLFVKWHKLKICIYIWGEQTNNSTHKSQATPLFTVSKSNRSIKTNIKQ